MSDRAEMSEELDLGLALLDHQLLDRDGRRCGKVDDLAIEGGPGETARVVALYSGPGAWRGRAGVAGRLAAWIGGGKLVRVPWEEVAEVKSHVKLKRTAPEYGLGSGDDRVRPWIERVPGARE
jgi:sporulation protein YlmC with PRC-barrel domain